MVIPGAGGDRVSDKSQDVNQKTPDNLINEGLKGLSDANKGMSGGDVVGHLTPSEQLLGTAISKPSEADVLKTQTTEAAQIYSGAKALVKAMVAPPDVVTAVNNVGTVIKKIQDVLAQKAQAEHTQK